MTLREQLNAPPLSSLEPRRPVFGEWGGWHPGGAGVGRNWGSTRGSVGGVTLERVPRSEQVAVCAQCRVCLPV